MLNEINCDRSKVIIKVLVTMAVGVFNELQHIFSVDTPSFQDQENIVSRVPWMQITAGIFKPYHRRKQWTNAAGMRVLYGFLSSV